MAHGILHATPIFRVENLRASIEYYTTVLGFQHDWGGPETFASVSRERCTLFLCERDQGHAGTWVWVGVPDADALETEFRARGARIRQGATNFPWAYEIQVEDPDGNVLRFGSEPKDAPFGSFMDMNGKLWPPAA